MSISNYLEAKILDHVLRGAGNAYTAPTTIWVSLHTSDPGEAYSSGEVSGGSYARQSVSFNAASGGSISASAAVEFTSMPAATVTHIALWDDDGTPAGNMLWSGALSSSRTVASGDSFRLTSLTITLD